MSIFVIHLRPQGSVCFDSYINVHSMIQRAVTKRNADTELLSIGTLNYLTASHILYRSAKRAYFISNMDDVIKLRRYLKSVNDKRFNKALNKISRVIKDGGY